MDKRTMTPAEFVRFARCMRKIGAVQIAANADGSFSASFQQEKRVIAIPAFGEARGEKQDRPKHEPADDTRSDRQRYRDEALNAFRGS